MYVDIETSSKCLPSSLLILLHPKVIPFSINQLRGWYGCQLLNKILIVADQSKELWISITEIGHDHYSIEATSFLNLQQILVATWWLTDPTSNFPAVAFTKTWCIHRASLKTVCTLQLILTTLESLYLIIVMTAIVEHNHKSHPSSLSLTWHSPRKDLYRTKPFLKQIF